MNESSMTLALTTTALLAVLIAFAVFRAYRRKVNRRHAELEDRELIAFAPLEIDKAFSAWSATTTENSKAVLWSGKNSEALYLFGDPVKGIWHQWARTSTGRFFYVVYEYQHDVPVAVNLVTDVTADDLVTVLEKEKRPDLLKEYGFKVAAA